MLHRTGKKLNIIARAVMLALIITTALPGTAFAAGDTSGLPVVKPRVVTRAEVNKYAYYKNKNASKIPVITYHKIVSDKAKKSKKYKHDKWAVSQSNFNKQMAWLHKKHYRTINCDEFYLWRRGRIKLPKRSVLITIDDGNAEAIERAYPVLKKYNMKATAFIVGRSPHRGLKCGNISMERMQEIQEKYPRFEFQSHTYNLHVRKAVKYGYKTFMKDAAKQREVYGFEYLAYPYGKKTDAMIKAYKNSGIRMAFSFGDYGFATRKQNIYKIKRIAIFGNTSMRKFKRWCR